MPKNHTDIGAGPQVCVTDTDAVANADGTEATNFRVEWKFQLGRNNIFFYMSLTVAECAQKPYRY